MPLVLSYAGTHTAPARPIVPPALFPILLTYAHIDLCWQVGKTMVGPICLAESLDFSIWSPLAWIPGLLLSRSLGPVGILFLILPSILAGLILYQVICRYRDHVHPLFGPAYWRLFALLLLWACWIPVPATWSLAHLFAHWTVHLA